MLNTLINISGKRLLLPLYHAVSDITPMHLKHLYSIRSVENFRNDIDFILKYYKPIDISHLIKLMKKEESPKGNMVLFSFDDGLREIYEIVAPILREKGVPAVFFVNTDFVNNKKLFYRFKASLVIEGIKETKNKESLIRVENIIGVGEITKKETIIASIKRIGYNQKQKLDEIAKILGIDFQDYLVKQKPYMSLEQLKNLRSDSFCIGSHSKDHPEYATLSIEEQLNQTNESLLWLQKKLNSEYKLFAFPFTDYGVRKQFFDKTYRQESSRLDLSFACAGIKDDSEKYHLQRLAIEDYSGNMKSILRKAYIDYILKKMIGKNRVVRNQ